jgi:hypothetical protein
MTALFLYYSDIYILDSIIFSVFLNGFFPAQNELIVFALITRKFLVFTGWGSFAHIVHINITVCISAVEVTCIE